jgi:hypothetical protein
MWSSPRFVTVTKPSQQERCRWCGRAFAVTAGPGRPRAFCRRSCRQREYEARARSRELGLGDAELVVARRSLDELHDGIAMLEAAIEDVDRDLAEAGSDPAEVARALQWLLEAARPLTHLRLDP